MLSILWQRAVLSLSTFPTAQGWYHVAGITLTTTAAAGITATATGFVHPYQDWDPPASLWRPCSALLVPSLLEEVLWRGILLPRTSLHWNSWVPWMVLLIHVASHPVAARTVWPRGRALFGDARFLLLATLVLGGATGSYIASGGSAWAAAVTHGVPVALWRDFFGAEKKLSLSAAVSNSKTEEEA